MEDSLAGVKILDLTRLLPGGFCTLLLADLGAEVLKIEDTGAGDYLRWTSPHYEGDEPSATSALFRSLNRGKRSLRVDLKQEQGRELLLRLVREYDVLVESFRPGVMKRLGVDYETLKAENPRLIYCAITGYGQTGPLSDRAGHDLNYLARTGTLDLSGDVDGPPVQAAAQIADIGGGALPAAVAILAALHERSRTGEGRLFDIAMADGALSWLALDAARYLCSGTGPHRGETPLAGGVICYRPYRCRDGYVALAALEPKFWQAFCVGIGREELIERQLERPGSDTHRELEQIFLERTRAEWEQLSNEHECCLDPVLTLEEALNSELFGEREMVATEADGARSLASPLLSLQQRQSISAVAPGLGEHTEQVLRELSYDDGEIAQLLESGVTASRAGSSPEEFLL